jgi:hypothetical protein
LPTRNIPHWPRQKQVSSEKMGKDIPSKWRAEVAIFICDKADFKNSQKR